MTTFQWSASLVLAATIVPALAAETHCPGNAASVPLHLVNRHLFIVDVSVNHSGPYSFLLDTGTQITMIDPAVAAELHLGSQSGVMFTAAGSLQSASIAQLDLVEAGSHAVASKRCSFMTSRISIPPMCTFRASSARISSSTLTC